MNYPIEFVKRVKEAYPEDEAMHKSAENGARFLGRFLDDNVEQISAHEVLTRSLGALREKALRIQEQKKLYQEWYEIVNR